MTAYVLPPWPPRPGSQVALPAAPPDPGRWFLGLAASYQRWPRDAYEFVVPPCAVPLYNGHRERFIVSSGAVPGDIGVCRRFTEVEDQGLVVLAEVAAVHAPGIIRDFAWGRAGGLSVKVHLLDDSPDGVTWLYPSEVSLTSCPADPPCRVISTGQRALDHWAALTGETVKVS